MKHTIIITLALFATMLVAATASAGGPVITFANDPSPVPIIDWGDCPTFQIDATFMADRRNETFYDADGNPVLQRRHVSFTGTLYNVGDPSKSVTYSGDFTRTFDYASGIARFTGLKAHVIVPGEGVVMLGAGLSAIDTGSGDTVVSRGPNGDLTKLCTVLG